MRRYGHLDILPPTWRELQTTIRTTNMQPMRCHTGMQAAQHRTRTTIRRARHIWWLDTKDTRAIYASKRYGMAQVRLPLRGAPVNWRNQAACLGTPIATFIDEQIQAYVICARCTVRQQCADYALQYTADDLPGIYGGLSTDTRRTMRNDPPPTPYGYSTKDKPFTHGTVYGYRVRKCRCTECRQAHADTRRRQRQNAPRRTLDTQPLERAVNNQAQ